MPKKKKYPKTLTVRMKEAHLARAKAAAEKRGIDLSAFCRQSMLYFADKILGGCHDAHTENDPRAEKQRTRLPGG